MNRASVGTLASGIPQQIRVFPSHPRPLGIITPLIWVISAFTHNIDIIIQQQCETFIFSVVIFWLNYHNETFALSLLLIWFIFIVS